MNPATAGVLVASALATAAHSTGILLVQSFPGWTRRNAVALSGFAGGVCVGAALLHLLPEASAFNRMAPLGALGAFLALYLVETHFVRSAHHHGEDPAASAHEHDSIHPAIGYVTAVAFVFHTLFD